MTLHVSSVGAGKILISKWFVSQQALQLHYKETLTGDCQQHEEGDTNSQTSDVQYEMAQIVRSNAIVNPGAMATAWLISQHLSMDG